MSLLVLLAIGGCAPISGSDGQTANAAELEATLVSTLMGLDGVKSVTPFDPANLFQLPAGCRAVTIEFEQPVDHAMTGGATFRQRLVLQHCDSSRPMVFSPDGYGLDFDFFQPEVVGRLQSNWLWAEHRFYGTSLPNDPELKMLTVRQAADDDHAIVTAFRALYKKRWISTGASNGGMNAVFHARFYPRDVDGTVAYVAPLTRGAPDERYPAFISKLGDEACRARQTAFVRGLLQRKTEMMGLFKLHGDFADPARGLQITALWYRFAFWMESGDCAAIPAPDASAQRMYDALHSGGELETDADRANAAAYYAAGKTELGMPGLGIDGFDDLVDLQVLADETTSARYSPATMDGVVGWLNNSAERIVFIYGGRDAFTAAAARPSADRDNLVVYAADHGHESDITMLDSEDRGSVLEHLARWADVPLETPRSLMIDGERAGRRRATFAMMRRLRGQQ